MNPAWMNHLYEARKGVGRTDSLALQQATLHALLAVIDRLDALQADIKSGTGEQLGVKP